MKDYLFVKENSCISVRRAVKASKKSANSIKKHLLATDGTFRHEDHTIIQTTLYDLIEAVNETVKPHDDRFVTEVVMDLLIAGHAEFQNAYH